MTLVVRVSNLRPLILCGFRTVIHAVTNTVREHVVNVTQHSLHPRPHGFQDLSNLIDSGYESEMLPKDYGKSVGQLPSITGVR